MNLYDSQDFTVTISHLSYEEKVIKFSFLRQGTIYLTPKQNITQSRTYRNISLVENQKRRAIDVQVESFGLVYIPKTSTLGDLDKHSLVVKKENGYDIVNQKTKIGHILLDSARGSLELNIDIFIKNRGKERKFLGYRGKFLNHAIYEKYSGLNLPFKSIENLKAKKDYRKILFKHKSEKNYTTIETIHEFYVSDKRYVSRADIKGKKFVEYNKVKYSKNYDKEYWENISQRIPQLNEKIKRNLGTVLKEY